MARPAARPRRAGLSDRGCDGGRARSCWDQSNEISVTVPDVAGASASPLVEPLLQSGGVVAGLVAGGEEQGDRPAGQSIEQVVDSRLRRLPFEFGVIGGLEVFPSRRIAVVAATQDIAWCDFLQPEIDLRPLPRQAAGPEPIHQDADAALRVRRLIDAFDA